MATAAAGPAPGRIERGWPARLQSAVPALLKCLAVVTYVACGAFAVFWVVVDQHNNIAIDFQIYTRAFHIASAGENPYAPFSIGGGFLYHPFALTLLGPFSHVDWLTGYLLWTVLSVNLWVASVYLAVQLAGIESALRTRLILLAAATFGPFLETLYFGQVDVLVCFSIVLTFALSGRGQHSLAGIPLALAIVLKTTPVCLLLYFVLLRRFRTVLSTLVTFTLLSVCAAIEYSPRVLGQFAQTSAELARTTFISRYNESLASVILGGSGLDTNARATALINLATKSLCAGALVLLCWLLFTGIRHGAITESRRMPFCACFLTLSIVGSPLVWYHHQILLLLPLLALAKRSTRGIMPFGAALALALIQSDRVWEQFAAPVAAPVVVADVLVLGCLLLVCCPGSARAERFRRLRFACSPGIE